MSYSLNTSQKSEYFWFSPIFSTQLYPKTIFNELTRGRQPV